MDASRPSIETGFMANDVDLAPHTNWFVSPNGLPPAFHGRRDFYFECAESTSSAPGGRTSVTKDIVILFQDYSQTMISATFDPQDLSTAQIEQRQEPPPRSLRQDQLEQAYEQFGRSIATTASSKKDSVIGDGSPHSLIYELLKPYKDALGPVGTRAFGALVYANLANASTQMTDEIRPGDIISIRNAKFQGKHGPMHAKYSMEVGKPDHVGIVAEWDGTKKKVRAWEQGRENKKVKQESFRLEDLRSGEVKIWRVMPRSWVGWGPSRGE
jgi:myosin tail region-interacting protein MTI1